MLVMLNGEAGENYRLKINSCYVARHCLRNTHPPPPPLPQVTISNHYILSSIQALQMYFLSHKKSKQIIKTNYFYCQFKTKLTALFNRQIFFRTLTSQSSGFKLPKTKTLYKHYFKVIKYFKALSFKAKVT